MEEYYEEEKMVKQLAKSLLEDDNINNTAYNERTLVVSYNNGETLMLDIIDIYRLQHIEKTKN